MPEKYFEVSLKSLADRLDVVYYLTRSEVRQEIGTGLAIHLLCIPVRTRTPHRDMYVEEGIPCIKLRNVTGQMLNITNCDFVPEQAKTKFVVAKKFDIIVTATGEGTAGRADIFLEPGTYIVTGENILLRPTLDQVNPFFLLAMLRSSTISKQLTHFVRGATGQTHLYWQDIADIEILQADPNVQKEFERIYLKAWADRTAAAQKVGEAKTIVSKAAGVDHLDAPERRLAFETTFGCVRPALRFDVEYYQPVYEKLHSLLAKANCIKAQNMAKLNESTVNPRKSPTNIYQYVDISGVDAETGDYHLIEFRGHEAPTRARRKPQEGDIIVSTVRPNRNAVAIIEHQPGNLVVSTGFAVISPASISPLVLFAFLKTKLFHIQLARKATAAMYPAVTEEDVLDVLVPTLSQPQADQVEQCVKESIILRRRSHQLLEEFRQLGKEVLHKTKGDSN